MNRAQRRAEWRAKHRETMAEAASSRAVVRRARSLPEAPHAGRSASVKMSVGEIVLRGFEKRHASRIVTAFERQLGELLRSAPLPSHWRQPSIASSVRTAPIRMQRPTDAIAIGENLACAVFELRSREGKTGGRR
jgi:hypothetical protein